MTISTGLQCCRGQRNHRRIILEGLLRTGVIRTSVAALAGGRFFRRLAAHILLRGAIQSLCLQTFAFYKWLQLFKAIVFFRLTLLVWVRYYALCCYIENTKYRLPSALTAYLPSSWIATQCAAFTLLTRAQRSVYRYFVPLSFYSFNVFCAVGGMHYDRKNNDFSSHKFIVLVVFQLQLLRPQSMIGWCQKVNVCVNSIILSPCTFL